MCETMIGVETNKYLYIYMYISNDTKKINLILRDIIKCNNKCEDWWKDQKWKIIKFFFYYLSLQDLSPLNLLANLISFFWMVTLLAWIAAKFVSSNKETK